MANQNHESPATLTDIREAAERLTGIAHRTLVMTCWTLDQLAQRSLFFKCENLQKVGAFKFRGACNAVLKLPLEQAKRGVVTHSSGNHAQALALAAKLRQIPAHIIMPSNSSEVKKNAVRGYGGRIIECEPTLEARETTAEQVLQETGGVFIHPYDNADIIAGQGTAALELLEEVPDLDAIIAPVGGGGLLSGTCIAAKGIKSDIRIFAAEPEGADDAARSLAKGELIPQTSPDTIADGLLTSLGELTWPIIRDHVERIFTIDDAEIIHAMKLMWERAKMIIEPSAAVPLAAMLSEEVRAIPEMKKVGVLLSGGNIDLNRLPW